MMIRELLQAEVPFAVYQLPGEGRSVGIFQKKGFPDKIKLPEDRMTGGFYFIPFQFDRKLSGFRIKPDSIVDNVSFSVGNKKTGQVRHYGKTDVFVPQVNEQEYKGMVEKAKKEISGGQIEKIVLSRALKIKLPPDFDPEFFYYLLTEQYPDLFSFFVHIPGEVTWCGATPELLAGKVNKQLLISALAGTQSGITHGQKIVWGAKEKHEHEVVERHIMEVLRSSGTGLPENVQSETVWSGPLVHLRTLFRIPFPDKPGELESLIVQIHPTPAVGGYPKDAALKMIPELENYSRGFYTGILGPWDLSGGSRIFVNLRSVQITNKSLILYTGGGITAGSDPQKEWMETQQKARAMLSVLEKMSNFAG